MDFRASTEQDRERLAAWIAADADHRGTTTADFFVNGTDENAECFAIEDENGAVLYFRIERALRVHIQFNPSAAPREMARTAVTLVKGFQWLRERAMRAGFRQIIFQSTSALLIRFCEKRFGFKQSHHELVAAIAPAPTAPQQKPAR